MLFISYHIIRLCRLLIEMTDNSITTVLLIIIITIIMIITSLLIIFVILYNIDNAMATKCSFYSP